MKHFEYYLDELWDFLVEVQAFTEREALKILKNNKKTNYWYQEYLYYVEQNCKNVLEDEMLIVTLPDGKTRIFMDLERAAYELDVAKIVVAVALNNGTEFRDGENNSMYVSYLNKEKQTALAASRLCKVILSDEAFE